jgi:hypothetical protein
MPDPNTTNQNEMKDIEEMNPAEGVKTKEETPSQFTIKVDGQERTVTLAEMQALAQKSAGADAKFQEASELRKSAEDGLRLKGLVERLSDGSHQPSETEVRELAGMIGVDPNEFAAYLKEDVGEEGPPQRGGKAKLSKEDLVEALGFDPAEAKAILDYSHQRHIDAARQQIRETSDKAVDKDEVFGKMVVGENKADRMSAIKDMVAEDVLRRIQDGQQFGAELVAASVQKVRAYLTKFGISGDPIRYPDVLGLGPGEGLPAEVRSETPIKRVSAAVDGDDENFVSRIMQKYLRGRRGS